MAYIGKQPVVGNFQVCDAISVVNGQAAYTMQVGSANVEPENANHMLVSLNGVLQKPGSSFTISGATITFASNLVTNDVIDFIILLGDTLSVGTPSDDSVGAAQIKDDLISGTTALTAEPADTDEFLVSDAGTLKRIDYSLIKGGGASDGFHAYDMSGGNASGNLVLTSEIFDDGGNYNTSNGKYTAPSNGKYFFYASAISTSSSGSVYFSIDNGDPPGGTDHAGNTPNNTTQGTVFITLDLSANQTVNLKTAVTVYNNYNFFGGFKIY